MITDLPEQLIAQAQFLVYDAVSSEANLRRGVSSAYYALFHLLIRDATANWKHVDHRARLARTFDHKRMKDVSTAILKTIRSSGNGKTDSERSVHTNLYIVAEAFVDLQNARHRADYDIAEPFPQADAALAVDEGVVAFVTWADIRDAPIAQNYLYNLLFKDRS